MPESSTYGSVRGVPGNRHPYRDRRHDQLATVSGMVRAGLGISIVPALTLYEFASPELAVRPIKWPGLTRDIYLVRRRDRGLSIAAQGFHDWVLAHPPKASTAAQRAKREPAVRNG